MIAYGTMQLGEAFRNVCRSSGMNFEEYNDVAKDIEAYEDDKKWKPYIEKARKFVDSIVSASVHPCAHVLDNKDLREEYGVVRVGDYLCVMVTSSEADEYKLLKNDYLVVTCWKLISETFEMIGQPILSIQELMKKIDSRVWDMYSLGMTATLNQVDGEWATSLIKQYKPHNLAELAMFVACLRPFFNSTRDDFINRKEHTTGSKHLDEILKDTHGYILFQESLMKYFEWLGVTPAESIGLIKKISKKKIHQEDFDKLTERLKKQWIINTGSEEMFAETFHDIQSCMSYGFAAPHALAVAIDSLYSAYLKVNYPLEYYTVCLNNYTSDKSKTTRLTKELEYFGIQIKPAKFRFSSAQYLPDKKNKIIYKGIASIKFLNEKVSMKLYDMRDKKINSFLNFLRINPCDKRQTEILITLDFFSEFGRNGKLMKTYRLFNEISERQIFKKNKLNIDETVVRKFADETEKQFRNVRTDELLRYLCEQLPNESLPISEVIRVEQENLGYIEYVNPKLKQVVVVTEENLKYTPRITVYSLSKGTTTELKINRKLYKAKHISKGVIFKITKSKKKPAMKYNGEKFIPIDGKTEWWIEDLEVMEC